MLPRAPSRIGYRWSNGWVERHGKCACGQARCGDIESGVLGLATRTPTCAYLRLPAATCSSGCIQGARRIAEPLSQSLEDTLN